MPEIALSVLDRGRVRADRGYVLAGASLSSASTPDPDHERLETPVYNVVLDHPEATVLWDTGSHPAAADGHWPPDIYDAFTHADAADHSLPDALSAAGYALADVDAVIASHLHCDHAGGLAPFAGTDVPVYVHRRELEYAYYSANTDEPDGDPAYLAADFDHDLAWSVVHGDRRTPWEGIELLHLPGHTPGMLGVVVDRPAGADAALVLAGDLAYVRANYDEQRPMGPGLIWSRPEWFDSVRRVRELQRRRNATVVVGHDPDAPARLRSP